MHERVQQQRAAPQSWRGDVSAEAELEVVVKKPAGMRLAEVDGKGMFVCNVDVDGNAFAAGIRVGDRLLRSSVAPGFESVSL